MAVSFRHAQHGSRFCWTRGEHGENRDLLDCLRQLTTLTWLQVQQSGGRGPDGRKRGLGYSTYEDEALRHVERPRSLSPDVRMVGVRASQKYRVYGFYADHVFYLLWFDRNHEIVPD